LETLRLPWIFSDRPELSADFNFSPGSKGGTRVELSLGGRFSRFGLPWGAARPPILGLLCEFVDPGRLVGKVAALKGRIDLGQVLRESGLDFSPSRFKSSSPLLYKAEFSTELAPGDYNVALSLEDKELSISGRRTLHVIVPAMERKGIGDLKFCMAVGKELDSRGKERRVLDPNPFRQVGGREAWPLIVAYDAFGAAGAQGAKRRVSIRRLRGDDADAWSAVDRLPARKAGQWFISQPPEQALAGLRPGVHVFSVEIGGMKASKTFEVLP
jgi:hypothetical protein